MLCVAETKIDKLLNEIRLPKEKIREMSALSSKLMSNFMINVEFYLGDRVKKYIPYIQLYNIVDKIFISSLVNLMPQIVTT